MALKTIISVQLKVNSVSGAERGRGRGKKGEKEHPLVLHSICFLLCWSLGLMVMSDANWNLSLEGELIAATGIWHQKKATPCTV